MKKPFYSNLALVILLFASGCSNSLNKTEKSKPDKDIEASGKELAEKERQKTDSINKLLSDIKVRLYNHTPLVFDEEGICYSGTDGIEKEKTFEVKDFNKTRQFKCEEGNYIQKLTIEGNFDGINIQFLDAKDKVLKELKNFNLNGNTTFSQIDHRSNEGGSNEDVKDKFYQEWFEKAGKLNLIYEDSIFYTATWKNNGWYIQ